ncbi:DUF4102 domain-containing protein [Paracoccus sp. Arc7-R13]|uniref:tyrosine-type recombinase/integrase n=1 Tax=Paracoccus sp. Arc7-R13 TaxID=2500532 RepID=UPI000FDCA21D|nr:integrase family protein [Paracoccus sp. Arc7-R13]AZY93963.1 DUF4102 domain-containing protein [Paracoccus sp. Arc7-R13]
MAKIKLTAALVREMLHPQKGQVLYLDAGLPGLGLRVTPGAKTYFVEASVNGRNRRVTLGPSTTYTPEDARREAKKVLGRMAAGEDPNATKAAARVKSITLGEAYEEFMQARKLKDTTRATYSICMRQHFADWFKRELVSISPLMMVQRHSKIAATAGPGAANGSARVFRSIWNYTRALTAAADGSKTLPESPTQRLTDLRQWSKLQRRTRHLTDDLFPAFGKALSAMRVESTNASYADFVELLVRTGLRRSEASGLRWEDISLSNQTLTVHDTKNHKSHTLPLSHQLQAMLQRRHDMAEDDVVFPLCVDPRKSFERLSRLIGTDISAHDLRRTFATVADACDLSGYTIKRLLNHAMGTDVTAGYIVSDVSRLRTAMQRISDSIDQLMAETHAPSANSAKKDKPHSGTIPLALISTLS